MRILAMGAHPDDLEIFCYGLLAACKDRGDELHLAVATDGAAGVVAGQDNNLAERRAAETKSALSLLAAPVLLGLPDGVLSGTAGGRKVVYDHITNVAPDLILTHAPEDYHTDHRALSSWVTELAGFNCPVLYADTLMGVGFVPDYYVDITNWQQRKERPYWPIQARCLNVLPMGQRCLIGFELPMYAPEGHYAEAYRSAARFPFPDIRAMIPPPPPHRPYYVSGAGGFL